MKKQSLVLRLVLISGVIFVLLIPLVMIQSLINEREGYRNDAIKNVYKSWAIPQVFGAPILTMESDVNKKLNDGTDYIEHTRKHLLPDELNIQCSLVPEIRYRGIYEVVLYKAKIRATGVFRIPDETSLTPGSSSRYYFCTNLNDLRGVEDPITFKLNNTPMEVTPGINDSDIYKQGFETKVDSIGPGVYNFELNLTFKGSEQIEFIPVGKMSEINVTSSWNNPEFTGAFLPSKRNISSDKFNASWKINYFNRNYPQEWEGSSYNVLTSSFGVNLLTPVNEYQQAMRTSKYGILIIILTFSAFFMIELFSTKVIHPVQYLLVGLSLVIFYSILLSLSEYIVFRYSYMISALLIISLITFYVKSIYNSVKMSGIIGILLLTFYSFMYIILQLQDYSLLIGNIALFIVLAVIMYITRKINWFDIFENRVNKN